MDTQAQKLIIEHMENSIKILEQYKRYPAIIQKLKELKAQAFNNSNRIATN